MRQRSSTAATSKRTRRSTWKVRCRRGTGSTGTSCRGHVDATGTVAAAEHEETDRLYTIRFDPQYASYLIPVGSIAVDGISLTVARLADDTLTVAIIPRTYEQTNVSTVWTEGAA